ncbi:hypothetical protein [Rothia nasimurium]|uniref:hypothetical protein n=1 Tax=Rothia nasimurium TaxID=85336 RepID=UPI001F1BDF3C|nr:hypothetical protein [Rothia nasimurium]
MTTTTATLTPDTLDSLTALAGTEPTTRRLAYEVHPDGGVFIPQQIALEVPRPLFESLALNIHRGTLEASPAAEESDYYEQYTLAADKVPGNIESEVRHDRNTNTATATYAVHAPMYLTGEAVSQYLKTVHQVIDCMDGLTDRDRPVNAAAHLLEAADRIEEYAAETESENGADVAAHLFAQYLVIFSAREYQSDFTPFEHLEDALLSEDDYTALEGAGLIGPMWDAATGNLSSYHLTLFAGE